MRATTQKAMPIVLRLVAAVGGGYAVSAGLAALAAVGLPQVTSMARSEATVLSMMLAFVVYLVLLLWGFAERGLARLWLVLSITGVAAWAGAWAIARLTVTG